jgi:hypothetical protein
MREHWRRFYGVLDSGEQMLIELDLYSPDEMQRWFSRDQDAHIHFSASSRSGFDSGGSFHLKPSEARDLAAYLLQLADTCEARYAEH